MEYVDKAWHDEESRNEKRKLNQAFKKHRKDLSDQNRLEYSKNRSKYTKLMKIIKKKEFTDKIQNKLCEAKAMRQFWKIIGNYRGQTEKYAQFKSTPGKDSTNHNTPDK